MPAPDGLHQIYMLLQKLLRGNNVSDLNEQSISDTNDPAYLRLLYAQDLLGRSTAGMRSKSDELRSRSANSDEAAGREFTNMRNRRF